MKSISIYAITRAEFMQLSKMECQLSKRENC